MAFQIIVKIQNNKKAKNLQALAQQIASVVETFTGKRTIIQVKEFSGVKK
jgi:hypothetical protein